MISLSCRWISTILFTSCLPTVARGEVPIQPSAFCTAFLKIYDNRTEKFVRLSGLRNADSGSTAYFPLITAPNADFCTLSSSGQGYGTSTFACFWRYDDREKAVSQATDLAESVLGCLPPRTSMNEGYPGSADTIFQRVVYGSDRLSKTTIRAWARDRPNPSHAYTLTMAIEYRDDRP